MLVFIDDSEDLICLGILNFVCSRYQSLQGMDSIVDADLHVLKEPVQENSTLEEMFWSRLPKHIPKQIVFGLTAYLMFGSMYFVRQDLASTPTILLQMWTRIGDCVQKCFIGS